MGHDGATLSLVLPAQGSSVSAARRFVTSGIAERGLSHLSDDAALAVSELVTNAVLHARTPIEVRLSVDRTQVRVDVEDESSTLPVVRSYGGFATTGRGLAMVASVASTVGVEQGARGKSVWFTLQLLAPSPSRESDGPEPADRMLVVQPPSEQLRHHPGTRTACLQGLPVTLWLAARQHHDAALRELALYHTQRSGHAPGEWIWFADAATAHAELDAAVDRALAQRGRPEDLDDLFSASSADEDHVTAVVSIEADLAGRLLRLRDALDEADALSAQGRLLIRPALPEVVALRDWCCDQVAAQARGNAPATRWDAAASRTARRTAGSPGLPLLGWDPVEIRVSDLALVAADDDNRIIAVSRGVADLLGWSPVELTGRRIITVIPERLRDQHVAGFTRFLATGQSRVLGTDLVVPVLHANGTEVRCRLRIEAERAGKGRTVFVATFTAA